MVPSNWTPFTLLFPEQYTQPVEIDLRDWSDNFVWEQDGWNGFRDFLTPPAITADRGRGDCEDYAFVIASHHTAIGRDVGIAALGHTPWPLPRHIVAYDESNVYSSGTIYDATSLDEYCEESEYDWVINRKL